mmetsp:Transcript_27584/g.91575  ORF Transcript_27584/g.91575 Transcript_27584/m.91575 type:complete len:264 (+) Transcript_27584:1761-2552(+)
MNCPRSYMWPSTWPSSAVASIQSTRGFPSSVYAFGRQACNFAAWDHCSGCRVWQMETKRRSTLERQCPGVEAPEAAHRSLSEDVDEVAATTGWLLLSGLPSMPVRPMPSPSSLLSPSKPKEPRRLAFGVELSLTGATAASSVSAPGRDASSGQLLLRRMACQRTWPATPGCEGTAPVAGEAPPPVVTAPAAGGVPSSRSPAAFASCGRLALVWWRPAWWPWLACAPPASEPPGASMPESSIASSQFWTMARAASRISGRLSSA